MSDTLILYSAILMAENDTPVVARVGVIAGILLTKYVAKRVTKMLVRKYDIAIHRRRQD